MITVSLTRFFGFGASTIWAKDGRGRWGWSRSGIYAGYAHSAEGENDRESHSSEREARFFPRKCNRINRCYKWTYCIYSFRMPSSVGKSDDDPCS